MAWGWWKRRSCTEKCIFVASTAIIVIGACATGGVGIAIAAGGMALSDIPLGWLIAGGSVGGAAVVADGYFVVRDCCCTNECTTKKPVRTTAAPSGLGHQPQATDGHSSSAQVIYIKGYGDHYQQLGEGDEEEEGDGTDNVHAHRPSYSSPVQGNDIKKGKGHIAKMRADRTATQAQEQLDTGPGSVNTPPPLSRSPLTLN